MRGRIGALVAMALAWAGTAAAADEAATSWQARIDGFFGSWVVEPLAAVLFFDLAFWDDPDTGVRLPFVVAWLVMGAITFTLRMSFVNLRGFAHAIRVTAGAYDNPDDPGEISHFQALSSALSATVGLGNIAGVAIAISQGGPGAVFWLWVAGFLGMSSKFVEVTLAQMYRRVSPDGIVSGGPMYYLRDGLAERGMAPLGTVLAYLFAILCVGGSLGGGNMFQAQQSYVAVAEQVPVLQDYPFVYGVLLAGVVALVILGGIKRIGFAASMVVPFMVGVYVLAAIAVLVMHAGQVPAAFAQIVGSAFSPDAAYGGALGVMVIGFQRAAFSNEAGVGSASIAHSAASTDQPVREGVVALLEPFIDTIVVCTMTALVVVVTGKYQETGMDGVLLTSESFRTVFEWFPVVLTLAVLLFAFSTMISWSYYGDRATQFLLGDRWVLPYRILFVCVVALAPLLELGNVVGFSDLMILGMAFPNILGALFLSGKVKAALDRYWDDLGGGRMPERARHR
ncbi:MAG: alanine:cation symporter family protein [Alphaproteobacteria bacterium]|nr:alanine:cation symporter family protein [Alphaproteobacteria bacterium]